MTSGPRSSSRTIRIWIVVLVLVAVLSFAAMRRSLSRAMGMKAETTASSALAQLRPGDQVKWVIELTAIVPAESIEGRVLQKQDETNYQRTSDIEKIHFTSTTPIVMGKASDLRPGAVVHVTSKLDSDRVLRASQIVILTGYVNVR